MNTRFKAIIHDVKMQLSGKYNYFDVLTACDKISPKLNGGERMLVLNYLRHDDIMRNGNTINGLCLLDTALSISSFNDNYITEFVQALVDYEITEVIIDNMMLGYVEDILKNNYLILDYVHYMDSYYNNELMRSYYGFRCVKKNY